jgi:tRNA A-37 threonylcarbamoyl transferase component Bud32
LASTVNSDAIPTTGDLLADKYRIERVLGEGGMGIVLAAMHLALDERVAIKFLLPDLTKDPSLVARFLREGRASIKIRSEHVVRVLDVATLPGGTPYMVMEYLEGTNLEDLVQNQGRLPVQTAVDYVMQAIEAIAEAHALGMVHRDLKPANLFLVHRADGSACVKVLDFGITKVVDPKGGSASLGMTKTSAVMGSPRYMSPEQMRSTRGVDVRTDIWALGIILHELLAGVPPFDGNTMPELLAAILQDTPRPLTQTRADVPPALERVAAKCLEKDPEARFADVGELTQALSPFGSLSARASAERVWRVLRMRTGLGMNTSPDGAPTGQPAMGSSTTGNAWGATGKPARSPALAVVLGIGALVVLSVGVLAIVLVLRGSPPSPGAPPGVAALPPPPVTAIATTAQAPAVTLEPPPAATAIASAAAPQPPSPAATAPTPGPAKPRTAPSAGNATSRTPVAPAKPGGAGGSTLFDGRK